MLVAIDFSVHSVEVAKFARGFGSLTVYNNNALPLRAGTSMAKTEIKQRVQDKLQQFDLQAFRNKYPAQ
jgi:ABC-type methionine transport system ATPase subunit